MTESLVGLHISSSTALAGSQNGAVLKKGTEGALAQRAQAKNFNHLGRILFHFYIGPASFQTMLCFLQGSFLPAS